MEHLPTREGTEPIVAPFVCTEDYDNLDFSTYPKRKDWTKHDLEGGSNFGGRSDHEVEAFFQTWLYFGCLIKVFGAVDVELKATDFIRDSKFITTEKLPKLIQEWKEREEKENKACERTSSHKKKRLIEKAQEQRKSNVEKVISIVQHYMQRYCDIKDREPAGVKSHSWPISPEISLSIMALGWALHSASREIYNEPVKRLEIAGWCKAEITRFLDDQSVEGLYYFGSLTSPRQDQGHGTCTESACTPAGINQAKYKQKHEPHDHDYKCESFSIDPEHIVKNGGIPLVSWSGSSIKVAKYKPGTKYVAISHVWSDGRGNPDANSLPKCQVTHLQQLVDRLYDNNQKDQENRRMFGPKILENIDDHSETAAGFWMDTLCVPVKNDELRNQAIKQMRTIYQKAHRVLVLDSWVQELDCKANIVEKASRLYLCNWQHRLWTLQEGVLARNLHFQFKDGRQTIEQLHKDNERYQQTSPGFYSSIVGFTLNFVPTFGFTLEYIPGTEDQRDPGMAGLFPLMLNGVMSRTTTRESDETICFATLLDFPSNAFDKLQAAKGEKRMEVFLHTIGSFGQAIIFNDLPRLTTPGFRWEPSSWLGQARSIVRDDLDYNDDTMVLDGGGLAVGFPAIKLGSMGSHLGKTITVISRKKHSLGCRIELKTYEELPHWRADSTYAAILNTEIGKHQKSCEAVIGVLNPKNLESESARLWDTGILEHVARATVECVDENTLMKANDKCGTHLHMQKKMSSEGYNELCTEGCPVVGDWLETDEWLIL